jgi:hypothetical protein
MLTRQIALKNGVKVEAANIADNNEIVKALDELGVPHPKTVLVLVGGAGGIGFLDQRPMKKAVSIVAKLAEETDSVIVDGGTQAGIMTEIGKQRKKNHYSFPLVGVIFETLIIKEEAASILDENHTHFFLIPGDNWGDESSWISKIATRIAGDHESITVLINGGDISRKDVEYSVMEKRPTYVMRGTGRMADEITLTGSVFPIDISQKSEEILKFLKTRLP